MRAAKPRSTTLRGPGSRSEPDLFWALRGGGGNFGVVTAIELNLFPIAEVYAGILWWPIERGSEVLHAWRELTAAELPDELTTVGRFLSLPPIPEIPEELRGKSFVVVEAIHTGDPRHADELLAPLRALLPWSPFSSASTPLRALSGPLRSRGGLLPAVLHPRRGGAEADV